MVLRAFSLKARGLNFDFEIKPKFRSFLAMVSLRFPFSFSGSPNPIPNPNPSPRSSRPFPPAIAFAAAAAFGVGMSLAVGHKVATNQTDRSAEKPWGSEAPLWASLSLTGAPAETAVEPRSGVAFPAVLDGSRQLLGVGLRRKNVLGLKSIDIYAFGVYAEESDVKKLSEKYGSLSASELKENKEFFADVLDQDLRMTVRLQIVYGRLSIRSVRSAFEESVGSRLLKFSGSKNEELLKRFTSLFKDEQKLPPGSTIDLSREEGYILRTKIDGKEVGSIQSKLLCRSVLDLYIGDNPFDKLAKENVDRGLVSLLQN
ncbi:putative chalcone isomerase [Dioscorea sansibarensis]